MFRNNSNLISRRRLWSAKFTQGPSSQVGTGTLTLVNPVSRFIFQRDNFNNGIIEIAGTYTGQQGKVEASWNGNAWNIIDQSPTGGVFGGYLTGQPGGQGVLSVRWVGNPDSVITRSLVGIGENFLVGGQSNACGMAETNQSWSHPTLIPSMFANDYTWKELADPFDSNVGQVDTVSSDAGTAGSCWMHLATHIMASQNVPVCFIPCPKVGTQITTDWAIPGNHQDRTTLYGSMIYRGLQVKGLRAVLWWQGESDAVAGTSESVYNAALDTLANTIMSDLGVKLMPCKLEMMNDAPWNFPTQRLAINAAINTAWGDNSNILAGADFTDDDFDGIHYTAAQAPSVADKWWTALKNAFGWSD